MSETRRSARGFTLVEVIIALTLLASILLLSTGAFRIAGRAWESADQRAGHAAAVRLAQVFMKRELERAFPLRWREASGPAARIAFEGEGAALRFIVSRSTAGRGSGLSAVSFAVREAGSFDRREKQLVVRREMLDGDATDFDRLAEGQARVLIDAVEDARFEYFGAENDMEEPTWRDEWKARQRLPQLVRISVGVRGYRPAEQVVALRLGEEAGCYINAFQRVCGPRR
jgi:general secretion pathway protein J